MSVEQRVGAGSASSPSLLVRLSLSAVVVLVLALGLIGLSVDQAFRSAERAALWDRLDSNLFVIVSGIDVAEDSSLRWTSNLVDSQLSQPASGLYGGAITASDAWLSPSTINASVEALADLTMIARGQQQRIEPTDGAQFFMYQMGLGWEIAGGEIVDLNVWVAEDPARLADAVAAFRAILWRWLVLAGVVILIALLLLLSLPIRALRKVAIEVNHIESGEQDRLDGVYPIELRPLTDNLNALMETERANTEQYQQALGDLAHALKTPLAVIQTQLDDFSSTETSALKDQVAQMQHHIRHELDRAARSGRRTMLSAVDIAPIAQRVIDSLMKLYPSQVFNFDRPDELKAHVEPRDVIEVLGNLLENSAKYGATATALRIQSAPGAGRRQGLMIDIDDNGPGISAGQFDALLQRGVRGDERMEGQGLGLSIVERIAASYQGSIQLIDSALGGLCIRVTLQPE
ncbi:MAG: ATP-binding protein [Pseudomonadota bacterium]